MTYTLLFTAFIFTSGLFSLIWAWTYLSIINNSQDVCCHHKPKRMHSTAPYYTYFECQHCKERSFKSSENIYTAEDVGQYVDVPWLCGQSRVL